MKYSLTFEIQSAFKENLNNPILNFQRRKYSNIHNLLNGTYMKQVFLVLLIAATSLSVSAQRNHRDNNDYRVERRNDKHDRFDKRQKEEFRQQLARINYAYDSKIRSVRNSPFLRARAKARKIDNLEQERRHELNVCRANFYRKMDYADRGRNNRRNKW